MLIVTADDYGKTRHATDSILKCFSNKRITSASAMVFMEDSERAASLASKTNLEIGLHVNFTLAYSAPNISPELGSHQERVLPYLTRNNYTEVFYNPFLANSFHFLFISQLEEYERLYGRKPDFYNGHHHAHLCANVLAGKMIPKGARVRRSFTFEPGERNWFNRLYRRYLNGIVARRFISTDRFYSIIPVRNQERLREILTFAVKETVEIEVHPENIVETEFLMSDEYRHLMDGVHMGSFQQLHSSQVINS